ncbi:hypothetical protein PVAP13_2NG325403 [Panicum virgatum]|uniref:Uncharacterized protein n=1 Tax=Panicum virgatum TaxID=38727 RepID=A0A8T0VJ87_PANVG|nr:hypothetical protein PVAP13_2NG325403 [Panicum virgatum]
MAQARRRAGLSPHLCLRGRPPPPAVAVLRRTRRGSSIFLAAVAGRPKSSARRGSMVRRPQRSSTKGGAMEARKGARRPAPTTSSGVLGRAFLPRPAALPCGVHGLRVACAFAGARGGTAQWGARGAARGSLLLAVLGNEELRRAAVGAARTCGGRRGRPRLRSVLSLPCGVHGLRVASAAGALLRRGRRHGLPPPPGRAMALLFSWPGDGREMQRSRETETERVTTVKAERSGLVRQILADGANRIFTEYSPLGSAPSPAVSIQTLQKGGPTHPGWTPSPNQTQAKERGSEGGRCGEEARRRHRESETRGVVRKEKKNRRKLGSHTI